MIRHLHNGVDDEVSLHLDNLTDVLIINILVDLALHHGGAAVVLDVALPSRLGHLKVLREALLPEVLDGVVVRVGHEVLDANGLCVSFEPVHQTRAVAFHLL